MSSGPRWEERGKGDLGGEGDLLTAEVGVSAVLAHAPVGSLAEWDHARGYLALSSLGSAAPARLRKMSSSEG